MRTPRVHLLAALTLLGCAPAKPKVICIVQNPTTGATVEMFKEIPFKIPADYDEKKHIAQWKAEQAKKGFTVVLEE